MQAIFTLLAALVFPALVAADPLQIAGPDGPLEAESTPVPEAEHIVIIIPGSGPVDRDGNAPQLGLSSDTYRLLAQGLADAGIASLRIDKRGFFGSEGAVSDPNDVTIAGYAEDARRWISRAAGIAPCVWLAGHSEGGLVALVAAQADSDALCGLILMAAPGRRIGQLMIEQFRANPANAAILPELESLVTDLEAGKQRDPSLISPILRPLFSSGLQRYMANLFSYDPTHVAKGWEGAVLILQGQADLQVKSSDASHLGTAMPQARLVLLDDMTHMLKRDIAGNPFATYQDPDLPLHEELVGEITDFVLLRR